jgi:hypothetical protein
MPSLVKGEPRLARKSDVLKYVMSVGSARVSRTWAESLRLGGKRGDVGGHTAAVAGSCPRSSGVGSLAAVGSAYDVGFGSRSTWETGSPDQSQLAALCAAHERDSRRNGGLSPELRESRGGLNGRPGRGRSQVLSDNEWSTASARRLTKTVAAAQRYRAAWSAYTSWSTDEPPECGHMPSLVKGEPRLARKDDVTLSRRAS